jgi:hypothetical protein
MGKGISPKHSHQQLAGVFFLGAAMYQVIQIFYCYLSNNNNNNNAILYDKWSIRVKSDRVDSVVVVTNAATPSGQNRNAE